MGSFPWFDDILYQSISFQTEKRQISVLMPYGSHVYLFPRTASEAESGGKKKTKVEEVIKPQAHNKIFSFT